MKRHLLPLNYLLAETMFPFIDYFSQSALYTWILGVTSLLILLSLLIVYRYKTRTGSLSLGLLMLSVLIWTIALIFEFHAPTIPEKILWSKVQYVGLTNGPALLLVFTLIFTNRSHQLTRQTAAFLWIIPLLTLSLALTNERHALLWTSFTPVPGTQAIIYGHGAWFWVNLGYTYLIMTTVCVLLFKTALKLRHSYRKQTVLILFGIIATWIPNIIYATGIPVLEGFDLTPIGFAMIGLILTWSYFDLQFLALIPIARDTLIEQMTEGVIVLDTWHQLADVNRAMQTTFELVPQQIIGCPVTDVFATWGSLRTYFAQPIIPPQQEIAVKDVGYFELRCTPLYNRKNQLQGQMIIFQDITLRKQAQLALQQTNDRLEQQVTERTARLYELNRTLEERVTDRTRELSVLYQVSMLANKHQSFDDVLSQVLMQTITTIGAEAGAIYLPTEPAASPHTFLPTANYHFQDMVEPFTQFLHHEFLPQNSQSFEIPVLIPDTSQHPVLKTRLPIDQPKAILLAPLFTGNQFHGVILQTCSTTRNFSREEIALLAAIADQLAMMIDNKRLQKLALENHLLKEKDTLARNLHDAVTQSLYGLVTLSELGRAQLAAQKYRAIPHTIDTIGQTARQSIKEMRLFIHQLRPPNLKEEGLISVLNQRLSAVEGRTKMQARLLADDTIQLPLPVQTELYYIAQESLNNILRHAHADTVTVYLSREKDNIVFEIIDNGCGFDVNNVSGGLGLENIRMRTQILGGQSVISSIPGQGTRIKTTFAAPLSVQHPVFTEPMVQ